MPRTIALLVVALALSLGAAWLLWQLPDRVGEQGGSVGGPFRLVDQDGRVRTDKDFRGRFMLVYFGYSFCPDVCPTTLALMQTALKKVGPESKRVVPVFVTVDPARDTSAVLKTYLASFGPEFVGLTGTEKDIARMAAGYRIYYAKHPLAGGTYSVDHSSAIYLMDPEGRFVKTYDDQTKPAALADDLRKQL